MAHFTDDDKNRVDIRESAGKAFDIHIHLSDGAFIWLDGKGQTVQQAAQRARGRIAAYNAQQSRGRGR